MAKSAAKSASKKTKKAPVKAAKKPAAKPAAKTVKPEKTAKVEKSLKAEKVEKLEKAAKTEKSAKTEKPAKATKEAKVTADVSEKAKPEGTAAEVKAEAAKGKRARAALAKEQARNQAIDDAAKAVEQRWFTLQKQSQGKPTSDYDMTKTFEPKTGLQHKILGWGYILENKNDRLEVIFQTGIKILISNYKP